ncbi:MAG: histidinol-phosphate transaminase [Pseudohongiellaceae bacterium]
MKTTRRGFVKSVAWGTAAGALGGTSLLSNTAGAQTLAAHASGVYDNGIMQLNQNESARGPGPKTMEAIHNHTSKRVGRGYSPDHVNELRQAIAEEYGLETGNVQLATGSTPLLQGATRAFCSTDRALITAAPTYATSEATARTIGAPIHGLVLTNSAHIDLEGMAAKAPGAGLVYVCNPNNPSGTVHGPDAIESFVRRVMAQAPDTYIHIDEAYINYADPGAMQTAVPLVKEFPRVFITRSFSKAHALAGMRIGYALGHEDTIDAIRSAWGMGDVNMLGAVAALVALKDKEHLEWERRENNRVKEYVVGAFRQMGYDVPHSHTNHIFVNLGIPASRFREACLREKVAVGRDFPPMENTHCRISLGSWEEMQKAVAVFKRVLA